MERLSVVPRADWRRDCEAIGFSYHSVGGVYWDESHCYRFDAEEIDCLEAATAALHGLALAAVDHVVARGRFEPFGIPAPYIDLVRRSWQSREPALLGRFDLAYDGRSPPKLLEYNADTPTALLEASVAQWHWLQATVAARDPNADQFNSLHEKLLAGWRAIGLGVSRSTPLHFACLADNAEDFGNVNYLRDVATQAGLATRFLAIEDIAWSADACYFVDPQGERIDVLCKLYPWEWMLRDAFGPHLVECPLRVLEPAWKLLLSCKAILPIMWELNPGHPNLLPAAFDAAAVGDDFVQKPRYSREGANVTIVRGGEVVREGGPYAGEGWVYQAYAPLPRFGDDYAVVGSWIVGDAPAGIGLREDASPITRDASRFVPHYFRA